MPIEPFLPDVRGIRRVNQPKIVHLVVKRLLLAAAADDQRQIVHQRAKVSEVPPVAFEL